MSDFVQVPAAQRGSAAEVFVAFLRLGLTSFGGPIAHLGYFRSEFVEHRRWLDDSRFSQLLALSQFLPGPASSQLGFAIGLERAGWLGGVAAFVAFTLPSAVLLFALAMLGASLGGPWWIATLHGLKLVAVVVVADGLWRMARQLAPDVPRIIIAVASASTMLWLSSASTQLLVLALGALAGYVLLRLPATIGASPLAPASAPAERVRSQDATAFGPSIRAFVAFVSVLAFAFAVQHSVTPLLALGAAFIRAGALVFGGGHVVLPLLEESVVASGWVTNDVFLTGYGAAQAVPGPMFSIAAYLGALVPWSGAAPSFATAAIGAMIALLAIFIPGFLLVAAALPIWNRISANATAARLISGVNAAVVGLLAAAFYDPVLVSGISGESDVAFAVGGLVLQRSFKHPTLWVLAWCVGGTLILATR